MSDTISPANRLLCQQINWTETVNRKKNYEIWKHLKRQQVAVAPIDITCA